jgi:hypothetical protein
MSNIVIPDGGNIGSASDPDAISIASSGKPTFSQGIANAGTIDAGTIADTVTQPATDYIHGKVVNTTSIGTSFHMLNLSGSTDPYLTWTGSIASFGDGGGSTVTGTTEHDLKFRTKGLYHISFSANFNVTSSYETRQVYAVIRGNGATSESTTELVYATDQVANTNSSTDYGNCAVFYTGVFNANDQINFQVYSVSGANINANAHISVFKIRSVA